jgi:hypothetical protein
MVFSGFSIGMSGRQRYLYQTLTNSTLLLPGNGLYIFDDEYVVAVKCIETIFFAWGYDCCIQAAHHGMIVTSRRQSSSGVNLMDVHGSFDPVLKLAHNY